MFALYPKLNYLGKLLGRAGAPASGETLDTDSLRDVHQEFIGLVSHEIKTPLTSLRLSLQMMVRMIEAKKEVPTESFLGLTEIADRQVDRLEQLLNGFLDAAAVKTEPLAVQRQEVNLSDLVASELDHFRSDRAHHQIRIEFKNCDLPVSGHWDRKLIQQALRNVLANAATFGRGLPIQVSLERTGSSVKLSVKDHGIGISKEDQRRIFGLFERGVSSCNYGGMGIGLYMARQIAVAHRGELGVRSNLGEGSTFTLKLPLSKKRSIAAKASHHAA